jgi:hypothetical protein
MLVYFVAYWPFFRPIGIFYGKLLCFVAIWYIFPMLVCCAKKNLATLPETPLSFRLFKEVGSREFEDTSLANLYLTLHSKFRSSLSPVFLLRSGIEWSYWLLNPLEKLQW